MKKHTILSIIILMCVSFVNAQELDLKTALEIGLEQNYSILISKNDEQISANNATRANAGALPTASLGAGYAVNLDDSRTSPVEGETVLNNGNFDQGANAGVNLNWTVFDGFKIRTNYARLRELEKTGQINTRITIENFIAQLTAEYYNYIQQRLRLRNFSYAVTLSKERLRIVAERYTIGSFSRLDLQQARVYFNADSSRFMQQQERVYSSRIRLNELMANGNVDARIPIRDTVIDLNYSLDYDALRDGTLNANSSLIKMAYQQNIAELNLKTISARNYPYVRLNTGYGYNFNRYDYGANRNRQTHGLDAGVTVGINLFDGNRRREISNARIGIDNTNLQQQELEQQLKANLANFWQAYRNNLELLNLETENLEVARENYSIAMERYLLGDLAGIEMREAQQSLLDAEERLLTVKYEAKLCEISLMQISGGILIYLE